MPRTYTQLYYHIVFTPKNRAPFLTPDLCKDLYPFLGGALREQGGALISIGGMPDHVHLLAGLRAHPSLADVVKSFKGSSSHWINDTNRTEEHFGWQEGYAAFTVSQSVLHKVRRYIAHQERHHRKRLFKDEMIRLFRKHRIDFRECDLDFGSPMSSDNRAYPHPQ